jgi:hypothetical protein
MSAIRSVDSVTELTPGDRGCIAITGSHGGRSSAHYALNVEPLLTVFNDAGVGKEGAGIVGLEVLDARELAACAVGHDTARIGDARSTHDDGVISHANRCARLAGIAPGMRCRDAVGAMLTHGRSR